MQNLRIQLKQQSFTYKTSSNQYL